VQDQLAASLIASTLQFFSNSLQGMLS
jgi:hypothetical protein